MKKKKELLFRLTEKDFIFTPTKGRGKGGQSRNKTLSACICKHEPSNSEGYAEDHKSFLDNKRLAFKRLTETASFKSWLQLKIDAAMDKVDVEEADDYGVVRTRKLRHEEV